MTDLQSIALTIQLAVITITAIFSASFLWQSLNRLDDIYDQLTTIEDHLYRINQQASKSAPQSTLTPEEADIEFALKSLSDRE